MTATLAIAAFWTMAAAISIAGLFLVREGTTVQLAFTASSLFFFGGFCASVIRLVVERMQ